VIDQKNPETGIYQVAVDVVFQGARP